MKYRSVAVLTTVSALAACASQQYEKGPLVDLDGPAALEAGPPTSAGRFPEVGDSVAIRHDTTHVWLSGGCCDILERIGNRIRLGVPCASWLNLRGEHQITSCLTGERHIK